MDNNIYKHPYNILMSILVSVIAVILIVDNNIYKHPYNILMSILVSVIAVILIVDNNIYSAFSTVAYVCPYQSVSADPRGNATQSIMFFLLGGLSAIRATNSVP